MLNKLRCNLQTSAIVFVGICSTFFSSTLTAQVIEVGVEVFSPETVTINFDDYANGQPAIPGLTISGTSEWFVDEGSDWGVDVNLERKTLALEGPLEFIFDNSVTKAGFYFGGNTDNSVPFQVRRNGANSGSFTLTSVEGPADSVTNWYFVGFYDPNGIDSIWFDTEQNSSNFYGFYDLMLDTGSVSAPSTDPAPIPTLSMWSLLAGIALILVFAVSLLKHQNSG